MTSSDELMASLREALREEVLILKLGSSLSIPRDGDGAVRSVPVIWLRKPGRTPRSNPVQVAMPLIGDHQTQPLSAMLRNLADLLAEEGR